MARAQLNDGRETWEVGQAIVAAWFRVLNKPGGSGKIEAADLLELKRVFEEIFFTPIAEVIADPTNESLGINVLVPQPPRSSVPDLLKYLSDFHSDSSYKHFHEELGSATIFGCGKR